MLIFFNPKQRSPDRLVVRTLRCGRSNPGSNPGPGNAMYFVTCLAPSMVVRRVFHPGSFLALEYLRPFFIFLILLISNAPEICSVRLPTSLVKLRAPLVVTIASANILFKSSSVEPVRHLGCSFSSPRRRAYYRPSVKYYPGAVASLRLSRLVLAGDVHPNPGYNAKASTTANSNRPRPRYRFPCKECDKPVRSNQKGILWGICNFWFHIRCIGMDDNIYYPLASSDENWTCFGCALPCNFSDSFFESASTLENSTHVASLSSSSTSNVSAGVHADSSLKCCLINTCSLRNKFTELQLMVDMDHFPIIALTETWLDSNYLDCELGLHDYNIHRNVRKSGRGGGVLLAVHKALVSIRRMDLKQDSLEIPFCEIQQRTRDSVLFGVVYRPPFSLSFRNCLDKISRTRFSSVILAGDFNFPNIDWHTVSPTLSDPHTLDFRSIVNDHFLSQCNFAPTRTVNGTANILDLTLTTSPSLISNTVSSDPTWFCV